MGQLNDHDPADTRAITLSRLGLTRETQRFRTGHYPSPARGGTRGYPLWLRAGGRPREQLGFFFLIDI